MFTFTGKWLARCGVRRDGGGTVDAGHPFQVLLSSVNLSHVLHQETPRSSMGSCRIRENHLRLRRARRASLPRAFKCF
jgi:hypothetical protein